MAYQSLYRRYRPQRFGELRGQDHLVLALRNAVRDGRVGDAYLFSGPRGTGKTSSARILAKALNCENVVDGEPCGECESCKAIEGGSSFDVFELDAASNNGVDAIRELVAKAALGTPGRTKVYILDEVHMLSTAASNALLKTLEEPPPHVVFVLATTDPQKVLPTIRSRTQHFEVNLLSAAELEGLVRHVIDDAALDVPADAIDYVVRAGAGSARDTLSVLDRVVAAGQVPQGGEALDELVEALCDRDTGRALQAVEAATATGHSPRVLGEQLIARLRDVFLASVGTSLERLPDSDRERVRSQAERLGAAGATRALEAIGDAFVRIQDAPDQRTVLEVALVRLTRPELDASLAGLVERVNRLERGLRSGVLEADVAEADVAEATDTSAELPEDRELTAPSEQAVTPARRADSTGDTPAANARRVLAEKRASSTSNSRSSRQTKSEVPNKQPRPPSSPPSSPPQSSTPQSSTPLPDESADTSGTSDVPAGTQSDGDLPTKDELTLAWGDQILPKLGRAKPRYAGGRWIGIEDGAAVFGLPNKIHAAKCDEVRTDVEAVLATHFGRPVPIRIVVDTGTDLTSSDTGGRAGRSSPDSDPGSMGPEESDEIDLHELTDANDVAVTNVERIAEVFPGAEVIESQ